MPRVGLISDTHALLRPEALARLAGSDAIVHGGDIGSAAIVDALKAIAPLTIVRGNNDNAPWARDIPATALLRVDDVLIYVVHDIDTIDIDPVAAGVGVVVYGHSHRPLVQERNAVLYVNPGSAGPRRFKLPVSVAALHIAGSRVEARIVELDVSAAR